jgi:hypothetical protein
MTSRLASLLALSTLRLFATDWRIAPRTSVYGLLNSVCSLKCHRLNWYGLACDNISIVSLDEWILLVANDWIKQIKSVQNLGVQLDYDDEERCLFSLVEHATDPSSRRTTSNCAVGVCINFFLHHWRLQFSFGLHPTVYSGTTAMSSKSSCSDRS